MNKVSFFSILGLIAIVVSFSSCKKNQFTTTGKLDFSRDTVLFDTIFTEVGTATYQFKIYNNNKEKINVSEIRLMGGTDSPFRINIDGDNSVYQQDIEIPAEDSLFGFVEVTLSVNGGNLPMVVTDSIQFVTTGTPQYVQLVTWGQDVYVHNAETISGDVSWPNDKPHLVYNYVFVEPNATLNIINGTNVHFHNDAQLQVLEGQIKAKGESFSKITFEGDRLESFYDDIHGQWYGIRLIKPMEGCEFDWVVIKNGTVGLQIDTTIAGGGDYDVYITNTEIKNQEFYGLWANAGAEIYAENLLVNACKQHSVFLFAGGDYLFNHCTFGGFNSTGRQAPLFRMQNYFLGAGNTIFTRQIEATFHNSIIFGPLAEEFNLDTLDSGIGDLINFNHCLIGNATEQVNGAFSDVEWNANPGFVSDIDLHPTSAIVNFSDPANPSILGHDLDYAPWFFNPEPSVGCYRKQ